MSGDLWASRLLMSQWPNSTGADRISEATQFSISPAPASTSAASKKGEGTTRQLAHFGQPLVEAFFSRHPSTIETRKEIRNSSVFSRNKTNKKTILAQLRGDQDKERDGVGGALRMLGNGADFPIGPSYSTPHREMLHNATFRGCQRCQDGEVRRRCRAPSRASTA